MEAIIVLSDGTTWCTADGCSLCIITKEDFIKLCNDEVDANDLIPAIEIGLGTYYNGSRG
jgi:hypothetical protein